MALKCFFEKPICGGERQFLCIDKEQKNDYNKI